MFAIRMATFDRNINCRDAYYHFCSYPKPCNEVPDLDLDFRVTVKDSDKIRQFVIP